MADARSRKRLTILKSDLGMLRQSVAWMPEGEAERDRHRATLPWRQWYNTREWRKLRARILLRDRYTCNICKRIEGKSARLVADHKRPHRGEPHMFWDESNVWCICKPCHDSEKQRLEKQTPPG